MTGYVVQKDHYCCDQKARLPALVFVREHPPGYIPCQFVKKLPEVVSEEFQNSSCVDQVVCHRDSGEVIDVIRTRP